MGWIALCLLKQHKYVSGKPKNLGAFDHLKKHSGGSEVFPRKCGHSHGILFVLICVLCGYLFNGKYIYTWILKENNLYYDGFWNGSQF